MNRNRRVGGPLVEEADAPLDLLDLAGDGRELVLDGDAVRNTLRAPHQVEQDGLLGLLVLEPGLEVDVLATDILAGDLKLARCAELPQRRARVTVAAGRDPHDHVPPLPRRPRPT